MDIHPNVSIIIPTYNSEKTVEDCLRSITHQTYKNLEIIVIDGRSKDKTVEICRKYTDKVLLDKGNRVKAKNMGIAHSKGKYLCFIDSDMFLMPNIITECVKLIKTSQNSGAVIIPEKSVGSSYWVKVRDFERSFYVGTLVESPRFFKRKLAIKAENYDEEVIMFEESTLPQKIGSLGYNVTLRTNSKISHMEYGFSMLKWLKKKYYYGRTASVYYKKYQKFAKQQLGIRYRISIFIKDGRFYTKPVLAIGVIILKILEYLSIKLGIIRESLYRLLKM